MKNQKQNYLGIGIVVIVGFIVFGLSNNYLKKKNQLSPLPIIEKKSITDSSSWTTYINKTFGYSLKFPKTYQIPPQTEKEISQKGIDNNIVVKKTSDLSGSGVIIIDISPNNDDMSIENSREKNLKLFGITGPLISYNFNGYDSFVNKNQPGMNIYVKHGLYLYHVNAPTAAQDKEVGDIVATFKFLPGTSYGSQNIANVLVQDGSTYGPPFDPNLYQLEISKSKHLFAKSDLVDLKKYLGKNVKVHYREVIGVIMGEQQLVMVESVE